MPDLDPRDPTNPTRALTHAYREEIRQEAEYLARACGSDYLRWIRAQLADLLETNLPPEHREIVQIRGMVLHEEIRRRETTVDTLADKFRRGFGPSDGLILRKLTQLPRLPPDGGLTNRPG